MGLRDDIEAMERYSRAGRLKDYFTGDGPPLPPEPEPTDPSAQPGLGLYEKIRLRGD